MTVANSLLASKIEKRGVFVCGGGHQGIAMAGHLALHGYDVTLWNRTPENIAQIKETGEVHCSGICNGTAKISRVTSDISQAAGKLIMVAVPSTAHKEIARRLAPFLDGDSIVVLNPGRTFGAVEFAKELESSGVRHLPHIAETQTIVYTCRRIGANSVSIHALKRDVEIASLRKNDMSIIMKAIPKCIRGRFLPVASIGVTSVGNVGMVLHCAPVLMNIGWIETPDADFKYYYHGISPSIASFLEKIDAERVLVGQAMGVESKSTAEWMNRTYGIQGRNIFDCIQNNNAYREIDAPATIKTRYVLEDIPNGLVPIASIGRELGVSTECIDSIITLGSEVLGEDFWRSGRRIPFDQIKPYL